MAEKKLEKKEPIALKPKAKKGPSVTVREVVYVDGQKKTLSSVGKDHDDARAKMAALKAKLNAKPPAKR